MKIIGRDNESNFILKVDKEELAAILFKDRFNSIVSDTADRALSTGDSITVINLYTKYKLIKSLSQNKVIKSLVEKANAISNALEPFNEIIDEKIDRIDEKIKNE